MSETTNHVVGFVGKCKKCKAPIRYDLSEQRRYEEGRWVNGISYPGRRYYNLDNTGWSSSLSKMVQKPCRECGSPNWLKRMVVTYNEKVKCGAKCRNATGPACECSCRGVNHGRG